MINNQDRAGISILYIEDDHTTQKLLSPMLKAQGYTLILGENGVRGLELFREHLPDIVLTDLKMPLMNGLEMSRAIRVGMEAPEAQIIVMTAFSDTEYLLDAIDVGVNQYVLKPIDFAKLQAAIDHCVKTIQMQRCLRKQAERIHMLTNALEQSPSMVMVTDIQGTIEYVNTRFSETTGFTSEEVIGKNPRIIKSGNTPDTVYSDLWSTILAGKEWHGVLENRSKNNTGFWEDIRISPLVSSDGSISKFISSARDITEQRKLEAEVLQIRKLEGIALLAGGMAHDFNNLLQVILGYIALAKQDTEPDSKAHKMLDLAEHNSWKASELSQRLLTFASGGNSGRQSSSLCEIITTCADNVLNGTEIKKEFYFDSVLPEVVINAEQMQKVFSHLFSNALEAMPDNGIIKVSGCACSISKEKGLPLKPGKYLHISIHDNGKGIAQEDLVRIFDPYFTTKETWNQKGLGLGLAICHSVIRNHDGIILVESKPEEGTTFDIYLPATGRSGASCKNKKAP
ncbi:MAG TPA: response regulator [Desulfuromonadaceae bacterium]|jgi:PAS domain S-box-containing protein